jgi:hypothetical protein
MIDFSHFIFSLEDKIIFHKEVNKKMWKTLVKLSIIAVVLLMVVNIASAQEATIVMLASIASKVLSNWSKIMLARESYEISTTFSGKNTILQECPELKNLFDIARKDSSTLWWVLLPINWARLTLVERSGYLLNNRDLVEAISQGPPPNTPEVLKAGQDQPPPILGGNAHHLLGIQGSGEAKKELDKLIATLDVEFATLATRLKNIEETFATIEETFATEEELKNLEQAISTKLDAQAESDRKEFERIGKDVDELKQTIATKEKELEDIKQASTTFATKAEIGRLEQTIISTQSIINDDIDARLNQTNIKLSTINATMDANNASIDAKFKTVDSRFDSLEKRISATSFWMKFYGGVLTIALILDIALH